ncbi:IS4/Tn5 family transposase DNA-binding protein, partial [Legionella pneumophila]
MDLAVEDTTAWSEAIFGSVALGDKRLTRRLIQIGKQLSSTPSGSLSG